jgi:sugar phosphate isomerase/epimerase
MVPKIQFYLTNSLFQADLNMQIKFVRALWGMESPSIKENLKLIKSGGFDAVEMGAPATPKEREELRFLLSDFGLDMIGQQWTQGPSVSNHINSFRQQFDNNLDAGAVMINSHTGQDHFELEKNLEIISNCQNYSRQANVNLLHEIHRGRFSFSAPQLMIYLDHIPELKLTADFSHWCCVHESFLADQTERVQKAIQHSEYIHARVGHTQSPQIPDPRAPEWQHALDHHLIWWDAIVEKKKARGDKIMYICPEFGPYPYMTHLPLGNVPITNLWEVNLFMKDLLQKRYG